jgi:hypothetical protein
MRRDSAQGYSVIRAAILLFIPLLIGDNEIAFLVAVGVRQIVGSDTPQTSASSGCGSQFIPSSVTRMHFTHEVTLLANALTLMIARIWNLELK